MFDDLLESTNEKKKTNKGWSVILSGLVQTVILGVLVLVWPGKSIISINCR